MTDEKLIDLWQIAQKNAVIKNSRSFDDLKVFAELVEDEAMKQGDDKAPMEPEDIIDAMGIAVRWFFGFLGVVFVLSLVYAMVHFPPSKPVPDCGSCKIYSQKDRTK